MLQLYALYSNRSAHENHPNFLKSLGHRPQPRVILICQMVLRVTGRTGRNQCALLLEKSVHGCMQQIEFELGALSTSTLHSKWSCLVYEEQNQSDNEIIQPTPWRMQTRIQSRQHSLSSYCQENLLLLYTQSDDHTQEPQQRHLQVQLLQELENSATISCKVKIFYVIFNVWPSMELIFRP